MKRLMVGLSASAFALILVAAGCENSAPPPQPSFRQNLEPTAKSPGEAAGKKVMTNKQVRSFTPPQS